MEKTLEILEKNVQWIVLGLAVFFLAWVSYTYVVKPPATVKIANKVVVAADVDQKINDGPVKQLQSAIKSTDQVAFAAPDLVTPWRDHMQNPVAVVMAPVPFDSLPPKGGPDVNSRDPIKVHITSLPQLAKADVVGSIAGMSVVQPLNPANAAGANSDPQKAASNKDLLWITNFGTISGKLLAQGLLAPLKGQPIDPATFANIYNTTLLEVTLQRQQSIGIDAQGAPVWKGIETVSPLTIYLGALRPLPPEKTGNAEKYDFLTWAQQNGPLIATPAFYPVVAGSQWAPPQNPANAPAGGPATAPADTTTQPAGAPANPGAPAAPPAAPAAGEMKASLNAPIRSSATFAPFDPSRPAGSAFPGGDPRFPGGPNGGPPPAAPFNPADNANANAAVAGVLNPFAQIADIPIWAHDENVKTGQTYRYRFIYKMKNPVFAIQNQADAKLINIFAIVSPPSDWTAPVTVPDTTKFWLAQMGRLDQPAKMDVFKWENGQWTVRKNVPLTPGDTIPGTAVTVVDIRTADPRAQKDKYVLLVGDSGEMTQRNLNNDINDPDHQAMLVQTGGNVPVPPPAGPPNAPIRRQPLPPRAQSRLPGRE